MANELVEVFYKAAGAAAAGEEELCLDALKLLKRLPMTKDAFLSTKIRLRLVALTRNPRKRIQAMASDILVVWKGIFLQESGGKGNGDRSNMSKNMEEEKPMLSDSKKQGRKRGIDVLKPAIDPPRSSLKKQKHENPGRDKIRELLTEALSKVATEVDDQNLQEEVNRCNPRDVAAIVEDELFKNWGLYKVGNKPKFLSNYRSFLFNIKDPKNPDFRRRVLLGHLPAKLIVLLTPEGMASDARRLENEKIREKAMFDCEQVKTEEPSSGMFRCPKCRKDQTTYYQMQTRRADEPMTAFVTCLNCSHRWRS